MADNNYYPPVGFYFAVSLPGEDENLGFQEASGLSAEIGVEEIASGGENRFKYRLPTVAKHQNLVLKRGVAPAGSAFVKWCLDTIDGGLTNSIQTKTVIISLLNQSAQPLITWQFHNAWPVKYTISDLHSQKNELVVETIELAYNYMETLNG